MKCDVLVVGGGPAGCSAARAAAKKGLKTVLIEEHEEIGSPVQCAEAIGSYLFPYMPFKIPKKQLKWKIDGMYFWANNIAIKKEGGIWLGYSINRKEWDKWLASIATKEGVELLTNIRLLSLEFGRNHEVNRAIAEKNKKKIVFEPKYVIGADGINSRVLDCIDTRKKNTTAYIKSYEMNNLKLKYPRCEQLFFGEFAPRAYAYIFPISETTANIGVGTIFEKDNLDDLFNEFIKMPIIKKQISEGKIITEKSGDAPLRPLCKKLVYKNVFLVGNAANQNIKPFVEGNIPGVICGDILGNLIFDISQRKSNPEQYKDIINNKFSLIKDSQKFAEILFENNKIENRIFNFILLGLMSENISLKKKRLDIMSIKGMIPSENIYYQKVALLRNEY